MALDQAQVDKLKTRCQGVSSAVVGTVTYVVLKALRLPACAGEATVDAMMRLGDTGDGYATRLYLSQRVASKLALNWNVNDQRILEQNWFAYSWKAAADLPLEEILLEHLKGLQ